MCARWVHFFRNGGAPAYRPPNPPQGGLSCSLLPFAVRHINNHIAQPSTADIYGWGSGCGSSRPVPAARGFPTNTSRTPLSGLLEVRRPARLAGQGRGRAGQGRAGQGRAGQGRAGQGKRAGRAGQGLQTLAKKQTPPQW